ncbi:uncharacterized protein K441DRAFT_682379 [Cenococcum geophilum 1.58]|uniref:Uncharacterized protein n=1 Tax=Cenococcum geophilum 1.58 TaxID=794803 RepID=A0ACC8ENH4_9PEZI|nr:hypothetical protein K441DRAFT_682379 [Cenococcum geophilum 1.58]
MLRKQPCLCGIIIWSIDYNAETGGGGGINNYIFSQSSTAIPVGHITVLSGAIFTVGSPAVTDTLGLPDDGNQNTPVGPGTENCSSCSFFRLIASTCCGFGSIGNPVLIPAPMDISLPAGLIPSQPLLAYNSKVIPAGSPLNTEAILPRGMPFSNSFVIPAGQPLRNSRGSPRPTSDEEINGGDPDNSFCELQTTPTSCNPGSAPSSSVITANETPFSQLGVITPSDIPFSQSGAITPGDTPAIFLPE